MSADNISFCPQCWLTYQKTREARWESLKSTYGKLRPEQFVAEFNKLDNEPMDLQEATLAEYYDIGISEDGVFGVHYRAVCNCGFKFEYEYQDSEGVKLLG